MAIHVVVSALCRRCVAVSIAVALLASASASADIVIDDFTGVGSPNPWPLTLSTVSTATHEEFGVQRVLDGVREWEVEASLITGASDAIHATIVTSSGGRFVYSSTDGAAGAARFLYDGHNNQVDNLTGESAIVVDFASLHLTGADPLIINVFLSDGLHEANYEELVSTFSPSVSLDFDEFRGISAVNLASIASIRVEFVAPAGADFQISLIHTVAVPASSTTSLLAVAGLVAGRRGRRRPIRLAPAPV